ncbi:MAG: hypothetical protein K9K30_03170 [Burkholderiaceae bacterium]|nr:hypothetical protein [Burkholderiaceae bacterium]MCF8184173.1 hypothetical protein [Polynucleobacter sp.]
MKTGHIAIAAMAIALLSGCANDLIVDLGKGDAIRLVGQADNYDCKDPAYAKVNKVETFHMVFYDGSTKTLCRDADAAPRPMKAPPAPMAPAAGSIQTRPLPPGSAAAISNGGIDNR